MEHQRVPVKTREFAQEIVDNVPAGLLVLSEDLRILSVNRWFLDTFRLKTDEVVGHGLHEVIRPEGPPRSVGGSLDDVVGSHDVFLDIPVADTGEKRPVRISITNIEEEEKGRLLLVVEDLSESQRLRAAAEDSETRLRDLIQSLDAIVWEADAVTFQFSFVSRHAEELLGYPVEQWFSEPNFWAEPYSLRGPGKGGQVLPSCNDCGQRPRIRMPNDGGRRPGGLASAHCALDPQLRRTRREASRLDGGCDAAPASRGGAARQRDEIPGPVRRPSGRRVSDDP